MNLKKLEKSSVFKIAIFLCVLTLFYTHKNGTVISVRCVLVSVSIIVVFDYIVMPISLLLNVCSKCNSFKKCNPCAWYYSGADVLVGYKAVAQADHNPDNTVYDAKRFIGKQFSQQELDMEKERYPFKVRFEQYWHREMPGFFLDVRFKHALSSLLAPSEKRKEKKKKCKCTV